MDAEIIGGLTTAVAMSWVVSKVCEETGTRIVEGSIRRIIQRRAKAARDIALEEIRAGRGHIMLDAPATDEAVAIVWRYMRAAEEGTARLNLRLMASIFAGRTESPPVFASEFLRWADLLTSLSESEIHSLSLLHRECSGKSSSDPDQRARSTLIPNVFDSQDEYVITGFALMRTGLVRQTAMTMLSDGAGLQGSFATTPRMDRLVQLADLEGAFEREG